MELPKINHTLKGILLIAAGIILLFDTLGFATEIVHTLVLLSAIALIVYGIYIAQLHSTVYKLLTKENKKKEIEPVNEQENKDDTNTPTQ